MNVLFYRREVVRSYAQMDSAEMLGYVLFWMEYSLREKDVVYHSVRIYLCPDRINVFLLKAK